MLEAPEIFDVTKENFYTLKFDEYQESKVTEPILNQIRTCYLNEEEKNKLIPLIKKFQTIFYEEDSDLSFTNAIKHEIRTVNNIPIAAKTYRYPYVHKEEVNRQIQDMLDKKIIRHSHSPYSAPVWVVPKKNGC